MFQTYKINSIFPTIQGEGFRTGVPSWFIRVGECNLRNSCWVDGGCDTNFDYFYITEVDCIINEMSNSKSIVDVVITGGEATLQFLNPLFKSLKKNGYFITIETNGLLYPGSAIEFVDLYSCSPKYSNFKTKFNPRCIKSITETIKRDKLTQIKFVVKNKEDIDMAKDIIELVITDVGFPSDLSYRWGVFFQPHRMENFYDEATIKNYKNLIKEYLNDKLLNMVSCRWGLQSHKILGLD